MHPTAKAAGFLAESIVKSFISKSSTYDLEQALGQYQLYRDVLNVTQKDRILYVAVTEESFFRVFEDDFGKLALNNQRIQIIIFDDAAQELKQWIPVRPIAQS